MFARTIFDELNDFRRTFDRVFDEYASRRGNAGERPEYAFIPAVETGWTDDNLNLRVVLPGVTQSDLKVTVQGHTLTIQGERRPPEKFGKEGMVYNQIAYGKFERSLELPDGLDVEHLQAHLHDGVLDIQVPVAQAVKPREVQITAGSGTQTRTLAA
ncbi:MAG: Hsp20/alpha crystallin family protein [Bryobacteraceae bacterium]